jgi:endonuclease YncB( thermonuclease family)
MPRFFSPRFLPAVVLELAVAGAPSAFAAEAIGTVIGVSDGDTLTLLDASKNRHRIRLDGIDAPERSQPYGQRARQSLANLAHGRPAQAHCPKTDRYGRAVCRVTVDGVDVGLEQIKRGLAWHYVRYANEQSVVERSTYEQAERAART